MRPCPYHKSMSIPWVHVYVALSYHGSMKFCHIREQSPCNWETNVCQNVALTVFHTQNICHHAWKTLRIPLWCFGVPQSRGRRFKKQEKLWDIFVPQFISISWPSPHDWKPTMHCNVVLTVFHAWWYIYFVCGKFSELHFDA